MNRIRLGGLVLAILLLGAAWWSLFGSHANSNAAVVVEREQAGPKPDSETLAPALVAPPEDRAAVPPPAIDAQAPAQIAPSPAGRAAALELSGTIVVLDDQGLEHRTEDGQFQFVLWKGSGGNWHKVDVLAGRWSTSIPDGAEIDGLGLESILLGERAAILLDGAPDRLALPGGQPMELRVRWTLDSLLYVRDRASGRDLEQVLLVQVDDWPQSDLAHPSEETRQAEDRGRSPIRLPPPGEGFIGSRVFYAGSPGYAWGRTEIDDRHGGERFVLLDPGGDLDIQLIGRIDDPNAVLRLYGQGYGPVFEFKLGKRDALEVSGVLPGDYRLIAQIGDHFQKPLDLGQVPAVVVAGQKTRVVLALQATAPLARVSCAGTLVLPAEWEFGRFTLKFELLDTVLGGGDGTIRIDRSEMQSDGTTPSVFQWKASDVQPGRYEVSLTGLAFSVGLDVPALGLVDARIEVPAPTWVSVHCVDDATGKELDGARVHWHSKLPEGVHSWGSENSERNKELGCFRFRAPIGGVLIGGSCETYGNASGEYQIVAGSNSFELRFRKLCSLKPILRDGPTVIPVGDGAGIELEPAEGQEFYDSRSFGDGWVTLHRLQPGLYTLKIPQIPGYEPIPDQSVRLVTGQVVEHVVQLVRVH